MSDDNQLPAGPIFASRDVPLRASSAPSLLKCGLQALLLHMGLLTDRESGQAADTGTLVHLAAELWHRDPLHDAERTWLAALGQQLERAPLANLEDARKLYERYTTLPANQEGSREAWQFGSVIPEYQEIEVTLEIPPHESDPTGQPVVLVGHCDQIRRDCYGDLRIWDIKTTKTVGEAALHEYTPQLAVYTLAAAETLGEPVQPGGLILLRAKTAPMQEALFTADQARSILDSLAFEVARIRSSQQTPRPGQHCRWCSAGGPQNCVNYLRSIEPMPKQSSSTVSESPMNERQLDALRDIQHRGPVAASEFHGQTVNALTRRGFVRETAKGLKTTAKGDRAIAAAPQS